MKRFGTVTIIGVGLIGGSLGLALKARRAARTVIGVCRRKSSLGKAMKTGAVDRGTLDIREGVARADIVVIATPPATVLPTITAITPFLKKGCLVTDVTSVKEALVVRAEKTLAGCGGTFVGAHPMAGSEKSGVAAARRDLFEGSLVIVTRTRRTERRALQTIVRFWKTVGAKVVLMSVRRHDAIIAQISHLPHLVASAMAAFPDTKALPFAATGFRDTTRIALSDPLLWEQIIALNRANITRALTTYRSILSRYITAVSRTDTAELRRLLTLARKKRSGVRG